jgi:hypothetical protein
MAELEPPWEMAYAVEAEAAADRIAAELAAVKATLDQHLSSFATGSRRQALRGHAERIREHAGQLLAELDEFTTNE